MLIQDVWIYSYCNGFPVKTLDTLQTWNLDLMYEIVIA